MNRIAALRESGVLPPPVSELLSQKRLPRIPDESTGRYNRYLKATGDLQLVQEVATLGVLAGNNSERTATWGRVVARVDRHIADGLLPFDALDIAVGPTLLATMTTEHLEPETRQVDIDLLTCAYCGLGTPSHHADIQGEIIIKTAASNCVHCSGPIRQKK